MADIWVTISLTDKDTGEDIGSKEFKVNTADPNHAVWFANPLAWARLQLLPRSEELHIAAQEASVAARRAEYEAKKSAPEGEAEAAIEAQK